MNERGGVELPEGWRYSRQGGPLEQFAPVSVRPQGPSWGGSSNPAKSLVSDLILEGSYGIFPRAAAATPFKGARGAVLLAVTRCPYSVRSAGLPIRRGLRGGPQLASIIKVVRKV